METLLSECISTGTTQALAVASDYTDVQSIVGIGYQLEVSAIDPKSEADIQIL